jgi:hypothetical protein
MLKRLALLLPCSALALSFVVCGCNETGEVHITVNGNGVVVSNPVGISCAAGDHGDCRANLGRSFTFMAEPSNGAHFDHWEGDDLCLTLNLPTVIVGDAPNHEIACTATFADGGAQSAQ